MSDRKVLIERLLEPASPPTAFNRGNATAHLFVEYSRRLRRSCYVYGFLPYDLWVLLESNPEVARYNERVQAEPIALEDGQIVKFKPHFVSQHRNLDVVIHRIRPGGRRAITHAESSDADTVADSAVQRWCDLNRFSLRIWLESDLRQSPIRKDNLSRLLRFLCIRNCPPHPAVVRSVRDLLDLHRVCTVAYVTQTLLEIDAQLVYAAIAELILDEALYSDIDRHSFGPATELSRFHEVGKTN